MGTALHIYHFFLASVFLSGIYFMWAISAVVLGYSLWFYFQCQKGIGRVIGYTKYRGSYYPVVEFASDGVVRRERCDTGSTAVNLKIIGRPRSVLYAFDLFGSGKMSVHLPNLAVSAIIFTVLIFGCVGGFAFADSQLHFQVEHFLGAAAFFVATFVQMGLRAKFQGFFKRRERTDTAVEPLEIALVPQNELDALEATQQKAILKTPYRALALVGVVLIVAGFFVSRHTATLMRNGTKVMGKIVGHESSPSGHSRVYFPVIEFQFQNRTFRFKDSVGTSTPRPTNQTVAVIFDAESPGDAMIDRGFWNWAGPTALSLFGLVLLLLSLRVRATIADIREHRMAA